jgi:CBS domain-containing protein
MSIKAASIMTRRVVTVLPDDTVSVVAGLLANHGISAAVVCEENGKLLGIISEGDLLSPFAEENALHRSWWLSMVSAGAELAPTFAAYMRSGQRRVRDLMTTPVVTAAETTTLGDLADILLRYKMKRVPIVRDGKLVGVVSRADVISAFARLLEPSSTSDRHIPIGSTNLPLGRLHAIDARGAER